MNIISTPAPPPLSALPQTQTAPSLNYWDRFNDLFGLDQRRLKGFAKALIAFFLATGLSLLPQPNPLGPINYLTSISTLFFHPNRTIGAQIEYTVFGIAGLLFGYCAALISSATVILVNGTTMHEGKSTFGVSVSLAVWMFILTYFLGWLRTTMEKFHLATVLAHIVIIFHLTNIVNKPSYEIDFRGINSLIIPLAAGSACSLIVNIVFWFESAAVNLGSQLSSSLEITKTLLDLCNRSFLLDFDPNNNFAPELEKATAALRDALNALTIAKVEAKREISYSVLKPSDISPAVASLRLIGQHLYGMALAARNEKILINQEAYTPTETKIQPSPTLVGQTQIPTILINLEESNSETDAVPSADTEHSETQTTVRSISAFVAGLISKKHGKAVNRASSVCGSDSISEFCIDMERSKEVAHGDKQIFMEFVDGVRGPLQELATTCALAINHVGEVLVGKGTEARRFERNIVGGKAFLHSHSRHDGIAKSTFHSDTNTPGTPSAAQGDAITEIALVEFLNGTSKDFARGLDLAIRHFDCRERAAVEKLADRGAVASPRAEVFLVFFFVYSLREVAKELKTLVQKADALSEKRHQRRRVWFPYSFSLRGWTKWWNTEKELARVPRKTQPPARPDGEVHGDYTGPTPNRCPVPGMTHGNTSYYPVQNPHEWRFRIWRFLNLATGFEVKFGIKFAVAITLMSLPAFADSTRNWFTAVRGQWGLITLVAVMSSSVGGSISVSVYRIIGTITGAVWGYLTVIAAQHNPGIIAIFIIVFSPPFMYLYLFSKFPKIGLVSLLTNQVVTLNAYTCHCTNDDAYWLAVQRTFTMVVGVIVAVFITTYTWPYIARVELRRHLGRTMQDMGAYYSHLLEIFLLEDPDANGARIRTMKRNELKLQSALSQAGNLLALTSNEPRLKGPFQAGVYREIIQSCQRLLDRLVGMRTAAMDISGHVRSTYIITVQRHRKQLVANILLYFYILSSALHSKAPLPPYLPKARESRRLLLNALQKVERRNDTEDLPSLAAYHAFALLAEDVIEELERSGLLIQQIVGENGAVRGLFSEEEGSFEPNK